MSLRRRDLLRFGVRWPLGALAITVLPACERASADKPIAIKLGRDMCELCAMVISEPRYAAERWSPTKKKYLMYDDIGCAVIHGVETGLSKDPAARLWVADYETPGGWLDAQQANFRIGMLSPMGFGFAAVRDAAPDRIKFNDVSARALERAHCTTPDVPAES